MGIQLSGGTIVDTTISVGASPMPSVLLGVALGCASAGWAVTTLGAFSCVYGNVNAGNGQTTTIQGRVYTYKTVLAVSDDILIGASALETLQNFQAALNNGPGEGTLYGTGTTASATVIAPAAVNAWRNGSQTFSGGGANLLLYTKGGAVTIGDTSNFNVMQSPLGSTLYKLVSVQTPAYQQITAYLGAAPDDTSFLMLYLLNRNQTAGIATINQWPSLSTGQGYRFIGHRYGFHLHVNGTYGQRGQALYLQNPYLEPSLGPFSVASVAINGGGEAVLTIVEDIASAGWSNGDSVTAAYNNNVNGAGVDGTFTISISGNTVTLVGSAASGTFTTGLGLVANQTPPRRQTFEQIFANVQNESVDSWPVASQCYFGANTAGSSQSAFTGILDGAGFSNNSNFCGSFVIAAMRNTVDGAVRWSWMSGDDPSLEPSMGFLSQYGANVGTGSATTTIGARSGQLYNAFLIQDAAVPGGNTTTVDGHQYVGVWNNDTYCQLMLAIT